MGIFSRKVSVDLKEYCRDIYDNLFVKQAKNADFIKTTITETDKIFASVDNMKLANQLYPLQFELFALAWTHKFISGMVVINQSVFTKRYLNEKGREDIWNGMEEYNNLIHSATLNWLLEQGNMNKIFNYNMRENLIANTIKDAQNSGITIDESIHRVNKRTWSANAWRQKLLLEAFVVTFFRRLSINPNELNKEAIYALINYISGCYHGAYQSLENIKIKN